ncbi:MAG: spermidine synthase [bacterium]|nr:spermidine synthase [bacterium]
MTTLLCAIFFLSGASALLFETLWFNQAGLVFGNSVWASSLVLAAFMAGLAVGNGVVARYGSLITRPVRFYAGLEGVIALTGVLLVVGLPSLVPILTPVLGPVIEVPWAANAIRLTVGFAVLLVPSTAMGATLPILVKALLARDENFGSVLGRLYGWNTLGAVVGAVAGEAALLAWLGVRGSALVAGSVNLVVAAVAFALSDRFVPAGRVSADHEATSLVSPTARRLLSAAFLSGFALLALEVVWFRFLLLFVHGTSLVFSAMLGVVLTGIALGGLAAGRVLRARPDAYWLAPLLSLLSGAVIVALYATFALLPERESYTAGWLETAKYSAALMLIPAFLSGAVFTCIGTALEREVAPPTRAAGWMTLWNTLGSGLGSLAGGFVLLPLLGIERSFFAAAAAYLLVAWLALPAAIGARGRLGRAGWALAAAGLASLAFFPFGLMEGTFLHRSIGHYLQGGVRAIAAVDEGRTETVVLLDSEFLGQHLDHVLVTNGHSMSSSGREARRYMKLYVVLPNAFEPEPRQALLISYGVGNTARALVDTPSLERIDVVDISREILEMSSVIHPEPGSNPLDDPRVHVHIEDGRYYLQTTDRRYDLITGEPPPPKNAGVVNLYTREYFQLSHDRLTEDGIHTYWLPIHGLTVEDARSIVSAYCEVFSDCSLWNGTAGDWMLVGSRGRSWDVSDADFGAAWRDPERLPALREIALEHPEQLAATFLADSRQLRAFVDGAPPLVDDFPKRLSHHLPDRAALWPDFAPWVDAADARRRFQESAFVREALSPELRERALPWFEAQRVLNDHTAAGYRFVTRDADAVARDLDWMLRETELSTLVLWGLGTDVNRVTLAENARPTKQQIVYVLQQQALHAFVRRDWEEAVRLLRNVAARGQSGPALVELQLYALCAADRQDEAASIARFAIRKQPTPKLTTGVWRWARESCGLDMLPAGEASEVGGQEH